MNIYQLHYPDSYFKLQKVLFNNIYLMYSIIKINNNPSLLGGP